MDILHIFSERLKVESFGRTSERALIGTSFPARTLETEPLTSFLSPQSPNLNAHNRVVFRATQRNFGTFVSCETVSYLSKESLPYDRLLTGDLGSRVIRALE